MQATNKIICAILTLLFMIPAALAHAAPSWQIGDLNGSASDNLSNSPGIVSRYSSAAADCTGRVHVVWVEEDGGESELHSINYAGWDGTSWGEASSIIVAPRVLLPTLTADSSGNLHLVYFSYSVLYYTHTSGGPLWSAQSWSEPEPVGQKADDERLHWHELIADAEGNLHLIYVNWRGESQLTYSQVFYTGLPIGKREWTEPTRLSDPTAWAGIIGSSNLVSDANGTLYALWMEATPPYRSGDLSSIVFSHSTDGGQTWSAGQQLNSADPNFNDPIGLAVPAQGQVHALWYSGLYDVAHSSSLDGGETWTRPGTIYTAGGDITRYGSGALTTDSSGSIHAFLPLDGQDIFYLRWSGGSWLPPVNMSTDPVNTSYWPRAKVALGNELHLVWNKGYAELALPDLEKQLAAGQYEILHKRIPLDAPALPMTCQASLSTAKPTAPPIADRIALETPSPSPTATPNLAFIQEPAPSRSSEIMPIVLGSGLSAILVLGVAAARLIRKR